MPPMKSFMSCFHEKNPFLALKKALTSFLHHLLDLKLPIWLEIQLSFLTWPLSQIWSLIVLSVGQNDDFTPRRIDWFSFKIFLF